MSPPPNFKNEGLTGSQFLEGMGRRGGGWTVCRFKVLGKKGGGVSKGMLIPQCTIWTNDCVLDIT